MSAEINETSDISGVFSLQGEEWRDVVGYEGFYEVSNLGRVKRLKRLGGIKPKRNSVKERLLKATSMTNGYLLVSLFEKSILIPLKSFLIHRLVAFAFLPPIKGKMIVNHKNGIKNDNRVENLEWSNPSHNMNHAYGLRLKISEKGEKHGRAKLTDLEVIEIRKSFKSSGELADYHNVSRATINGILRRATWKHLK